MKIGILGSGMVSQTLSVRLADLGHEVMVGTRDPNKLTDWVRSAGVKVKIGSFAEAAAHGEMVFNATAGTGSMQALNMAGEVNLSGKVLVDISNPLDFSNGMPPSLSVYNTDSLGKQIQRAFPSVKVVKTLNTVNANVMAYPRKVADGDHDVFLSGNDVKAKAQVAEILKSFGWLHIIDLGDILTARGVEMYLPLWLHLWGNLQTGLFNIKVMR